MITVTALFVLAALSLIAGVLYALRLMGRRTDSLYTEVILSDAEWAVSREDRAALESDAHIRALVGWDMPDYQDHAAAARATVERYDLEREMVADLDSIILWVEDADA